MSRIIKDRNNRTFEPHKPIGISATKRGASLTIAETLKKTSIIERQKMVDESPLYDEFAAGTPIESLDLLDYIDLGVQPLDFTDADELRRVAKAQVEEQYEKFQKFREQQSASQVNNQSASQGTSLEGSDVKVL